MKKILLIVALFGCSLVYGQAPQASSGNKVGYASMEYIVSQLPDMKEIESEMKSTQTQLRNQIQTKSQEVQKQYKDFSENMNSMSDTLRASKQSEIEAAMAELEQMQQNAQQTLQNKQKLYMAPVYLKVNKAIQEVAKENGFDIILTDRVSNFDFLLFHSQQFDISNLVLKKFGITPPAK